MAFVSNAPEEEKQDQPGQQGPVAPVGGSGAVHLAPSSGLSSTGGGGTSGATPTAGGAAPAGGQFASLNQYIGANQGQATPLAGKLTDQIGQQYNTLSGQNDTTLSGINSQISSSSVPNQDTINSTIAKESASPTSFASDPNNVKSFQGLLNASYSGPASAEGTTSFTDQQTALNNAIAAGNANTTTAAGRENLLSQNEATPTTGVTALNSSILSQDPNALGSVENAYKPFGNLLTNLNAGASAADQQIAAQQANAAAANQAASGAISNQIGGLNTDVNGQLANANTANTNFVNNYNSIIGGLNGGTLTTDQISQLGMTPEQYAALQAQVGLADTSQYMTGHNFGAASATTGINNDQFLTQEAAPAAVNANQVATPQQFQTLMALMSLNNGQLPTGAVLDPNAVSQAGTYVAPTLNGAFNYNQALQNATTIEQQERADAQAQADQLTAAADAAHAASKHGGGILGGLAQDITHPISTIGSVINPLSWGSNIQNIVAGKPVQAGAINPLKPATSVVTPQQANQLTGAALTAAGGPALIAHGGVIPEKNKRPLFENLINDIQGAK